MKLTTIFSKKNNATVSENPYISARGSWNLHVGSLLSSRLGWQLIAAASLLITLTMVGGFIKVATSSQFIPYIVKVDEIGRAEAVRPAAEIETEADKIKIFKAYLVGWVANARMVTPDISLQEKAIYAVYSMLNGTDPATTKMNEFYNKTEDSTPFKRAEKETVSVEIIGSPLKLSDSTWQVEWTETVRDREGSLKDQFRMKVALNVYQIEPTNETTESQLLKNPLGIFIKDYDWSKQN